MPFDPCEWCGNAEKDCTCGEWCSCEQCQQPHEGDTLCDDCGCCQACCTCKVSLAK